MEMNHAIFLGKMCYYATWLMILALQMTKRQKKSHSDQYY